MGRDALKDLTIRPLGVSDIIDRALAVYRRHFRVLFPLTLLFEAPAYGLTRLYAARMRALLSEGWLAQAEKVDVRALGSFVGFSAIVAVLGYFTYLCIAASLATAIAPTLQGQATDLSLREALGRIGRRFGAIVSASSLQVCALVLAAGVGAAPGVALVLGVATRALPFVDSLPPTLAFAISVIGFLLSCAGAFLALFLVLLRLALAPAAAGVEGLYGWGALRRSMRLMASPPTATTLQRPAIRASILLLATFVISATTQSVLAVPRIVMQGGTAGLLSGEGATLSMPAQIGLMVFEACGAAAIEPFSVIALAVFYFDRRARREGLDLEIWADRLSSTEAKPAPNLGMS